METLKASDGTLIHYDGVTATVEKPKNTSVLWKPYDGQIYYFLGSTTASFFNWHNGWQDNETMRRHQLFPTEEEALAADKKRIAEMKVKRWIAEANGEWKPQWKNCFRKHCLIWDEERQGIVPKHTDVEKHKENAFFMKTEAVARELLRALPEECMLVFGPEA